MIDPSVTYTVTEVVTTAKDTLFGIIFLPIVLTILVVVPAIFYFIHWLSHRATWGNAMNAGKKWEKDNGINLFDD